MGTFLTPLVQDLIDDMKQYFPFLQSQDMIINTSLSTIFVSPHSYSKILRDINTKLSYNQGSFLQNKMNYNDP